MATKKQQQNRLHIPAPCPFLWENMHPVASEKSRHCPSCKKHVVDFSSSSPEEIQHHLSLSTGMAVCGRFETHQVRRLTWYQEKLLRNYHQLNRERPRYTFRAALLFGLGILLWMSGCVPHTMGELVPESTDTLPAGQPFSTDTAAVEISLQNIVKTPENLL